MKNNQFRILGAVILCSSLLSCKSIEAKQSTQLQTPTAESATAQSSEDTAESVALTLPSGQPATRLVDDLQKSVIFNQILQQKQKLGLCQDSIDHTEPRATEVFSNGQGQYLVNVLCFTAAYQGAYEFILVEGVNNQFEIKHSGLSLAGYPTLDKKTNVLYNDYKLNGAGSCIQSSQHHWDGYQLKLVSSVFEDGVENGCKDLGVRSPSADKLITATSVGPAKLGMTLAELRQVLPSNAKLEPTQLGVDLPSGARVSFGGEVQYDLAFDSENAKTSPIFDQSRIKWIIARNPLYQTAEGVGPGTLLKEAVSHYGAATLAYNYESESRESIDFAKGPFSTTSGTRVWIRSNQWTLTDFAGLYPEDEQRASYQQTQNYRDHAAIGSIAIYQSPAH
ncbi:hypothetical protein C1752_01844 [Acaryochloris thomasi RCC1774]|uniref:Lipoprotein n=1 Tax=Acaryochloris thomasi RCC1774 TaxID=1764569 RepID=A0A2W1JKP7_9CYAN|nr:hypothetical protein [Acaryochloris thomasi]PZD73776.1 hypothetical protein C1752_01844 [Acaryochloris thomasi RCC1774]